MDSQKYYRTNYGRAQVQCISPHIVQVLNVVPFRWWNYVNDEGESVWVFEKGGDEVDLRLSKAEVQIFWTGLVASPVIWVRINF